MARSNMKLFAAVLVVYLIAALAVQMVAAAEPAKEAAKAAAPGASAGAAPAPAPKGDAASLVPAGFACISVMALGFFF